MKTFVIMVISLIATLLFNGCAKTTITPQKHVTLEAPIKKLNISVMVGKIVASTPSSTDYINKTVQDIMPLIKERIPVVFAANGLAVVSSNEQYLITLVPTQAKHIFYKGTYGGHVELTIVVSIKDKTTNVTVWEASIRFWRPALSVVDNDVADNFIQELITQLQHDEMIKTNLNKAIE